MKSISRRSVISQGALALPLASAAQGPPAEPKRKIKVIVAGGHPGDPEYACGGIAARYSAAGHDVAFLYLNKGEPNGAVRTAEAEKACEILGARPLWAGQLDGKAIVDSEHYESFQKIIAAEKPDVLFTHWPVDNHRDHRAISMLSYDAWLRLGKHFEFYYFEVSDGEDTLMFSPSHYVDITAVELRKRAACYAHASQTPERYYPLQDEVARFRGVESGHTRAEAFIRHVWSEGKLLL